MLVQSTIVTFLSTSAVATSVQWSAEDLKSESLWLL